VELRAAGGAVAQDGAQLVAVQRAVRDHEHPRIGLGPRATGRGSRLSKGLPALWILGRDLPDERADDGAEQQRDADERIEDRAERDRGGDERAAPHRDVERVRLAADWIAHASPLRPSLP
jgi:hypothetical protein